MPSPSDCSKVFQCLYPSTGLNSCLLRIWTRNIALDATAPSATDQPINSMCRQLIGDVRKHPPIRLANLLVEELIQIQPHHLRLVAHAKVHAWDILQDEKQDAAYDEACTGILVTVKIARKGHCWR